VEIRLNIVVVEDHNALREALVEMFLHHGHRALGVADAEALDDEAGREPIDVLVIDLNLPGEDGLSLTRRVREAHPDVLIILCTARTAVEDRVAGYHHGADVYLTKPVAPAELLAAAQMASRRRVAARLADSRSLVLEFHALRVTLTQGEAACRSIAVTRDEATLLAAFSRAAGAQLSTWQITELLGGDPESINKAALETRIHRLRQKLRELLPDHECLRALRGHGYMLCVPLTCR
jgi:DNA-binding response OmpR family regulator